MPATGGGATTIISASRSSANFRSNSACMPGIDLRGSRARSWNGSSTRKIAPEFGALVKVAPDKPTMFTAPMTPGVSSDRSTARRITASVRWSEEAGGSCATTIRYPRSTCGMKPSGVLRNSLRPKARIPA